MSCSCIGVCFFFQAEDGIRDLVRSRGLGDVYKRQVEGTVEEYLEDERKEMEERVKDAEEKAEEAEEKACLLYTSDAADERSSVDLGGRRIIKKKKRADSGICRTMHTINLQDRSMSARE